VDCLAYFHFHQRQSNVGAFQKKKVQRWRMVMEGVCEDNSLDFKDQLSWKPKIAKITLRRDNTASL